MTVKLFVMSVIKQGEGRKYKTDLFYVSRLKIEITLEKIH